MMKRHLLSIVRTVALCAILASQTIPTFAQEDLHPAPLETIHLKVGDIFEILPIHDVQDATYTWILTQDRTFLEANRAPSFRKRLIQPGMYTLYAEIASADGSRRISRTISLDYSARQPGETTDAAPAANDSILVRTEPAADEQGRVGLAAGTQLLELLPVNPDVVPLALDLDLTKDADGDGKPDNDIQADDTFFHSDATPLFLWITDDPLTTHSLSVTAAGVNGARTQKLDVLSSDIAKAQGVVKSPVRIETESTGDRSYIFTAVFENPDAAAGQLLYQWQFGDGQQSLITKPNHTYADDGTYSVSLLIRNLRDGSEVASTSVALSVTPTTGEQPSSEVSSQSSEPTTAPTKNSSMGIGSIMLLAGLFILSILLGVAIIFLLGRFKGNKTTLADKLETIEKTMVTSPAQQTPNLPIAPPVVAQEKKLQEPPASIAEREKEVAVEPPAPQPTPKQETVPAWLTPTTPKPTAAPAAAPTPQAPKQAAPAPVQTSKAAPAAPTAAQTPAWLQQPAAPQAPKTPTPAPKAATPTPIVPPSPKPQSQPTVATPSVQPATPTPVQKPQQSTPPIVPFNPATLPTPKPAQAAEPATPIAAPVKPVAPAAPVVAPTPKPVPAPVQPVQAPVAAATPAPAPQPVIPATPAIPAAPVEMDIPPAGDQPIAIIRAESLNPPKEA